jgi:ActR/RegA family two-component response regulator
METKCKGNILLVIKQKMISEAMQKQISRRGYIVYIATSTEDALNVLHQKPVDILMTEIIMPEGMDGIELITKAKKMYCHLQCIVITGHANYEIAIQAMQAGTINILRKPAQMNIEVIEDAIKKGMEKVNQIKDILAGKPETECLRIKATRLIKLSWYYYSFLNPNYNFVDFATDINNEYDQTVWRITKVDGTFDAKTFRHYREFVPKKFDNIKVILTAKFTLKLMLKNKDHFENDEIDEFKQLTEAFINKVKWL